MTEDRRRIEELLPFAANGTLDAAERAELDAALAEDASLASELRFIEALRDQVRAREVAASPGDFGLARLKRAIAAETAAAGAAAPVSRRSTVWWKVAAVAACAVLAVQTAYQLSRGPEPTVTLAGGGSEAAEAVFTVAFSPEATEAELRALLLEAGVEIVSGPSALGLYRLAPSAGDIDLDAAETALRGAALVEDVSRD